MVTSLLNVVVSMSSSVPRILRKAKILNSGWNYNYSINDRKKIEEKYQKGNKKGHLSYPLSSILRMENEFVVTIKFHGTVYHVPLRFSVAPFFRRKMHHNSKKKKKVRYFWSMRFVLLFASLLNLLAVRQHTRSCIQYRPTEEKSCIPCKLHKVCHIE